MRCNVKTIYEYENSIRIPKRIDRKTAHSLLRLYKMSYYYAANSGLGGVGADFYRDYVEGKLLFICTCKLEDGTTLDAYLSAYCGTERTARKLMREWNAIRDKEDALIA